MRRHYVTVFQWPRVVAFTRLFISSTIRPRFSLFRFVRRTDIYWNRICRSFARSTITSIIGPGFGSASKTVKKRRIRTRLINCTWSYAPRFVRVSVGDGRFYNHFQIPKLEQLLLILFRSGVRFPLFKEYFRTRLVVSRWVLIYYYLHEIVNWNFCFSHRVSGVLSGTSNDFVESQGGASRAVLRVKLITFNSLGHRIDRI